MSWSLVVLLVPLLPIAGSLTTAWLMRSGARPDVAVRVATYAGAGAAAAAALVVVGVATAEPWSLVATGDDGAAWIGLVADRSGAILGLLAAVVGLVVVSFGSRALEGDPRLTRFVTLTGVLTASTTTVAFAATLSLLVMGWVATTLYLSALLRHRAGWAPAEHAARLTRRTMLIGDAALAVAAITWFTAVGDVDLRRLDDATAGLDESAFVGVSALHVVAVLLVVGGLCRSALVPAHRWLPATLAAPTPVSAVLHAGVVNGLGVLLVRTAPVVGESAAAMWLVYVSGVVTAVLATTVMLVRTDVKGGLVWSTGGQMGFMAVQLAVGAFAAALFHIVGHALYKASLFLGSGGAITAETRGRHAPHPARTMGRGAADTLAAIVPAAAILAGFTIADPHLSSSGAVLVATFGWLSGVALLRGWLGAVSATPVAVLLGVGGTVVAGAGYVIGLSAFEHFVAPAVPFEVGAAVPTTVLVVTIAAIAVLAAAVRWLPGTAARSVRASVFGALVGYGAPRGDGAAAGPRAVADTRPATVPAPVQAMISPTHP